jgi:hypothetical protein
MLLHAAERLPDGQPTRNATGEILYKECIGKSGESRAKKTGTDFSCRYLRMATE